MMRLRACAGVVSRVTVENCAASPFFASSTERWPVAMTCMLCNRGSTSFLPFWSMVSIRSIRSPGSSMPEIELISSTTTVMARRPAARRAEKVGTRLPAIWLHRIISPALTGKAMALPATRSKSPGCTAPEWAYSTGILRTAALSLDRMVFCARSVLATTTLRV